MSAPYTLALTPGALADLDRLDTFLRRKNPAAADRMAPPLPAATEVLRRCRDERLGHRFAENMF